MSLKTSRQTCSASGRTSHRVDGASKLGNAKRRCIRFDYGSFRSEELDCFAYTGVGKQEEVR